MTPLDMYFGDWTKVHLVIERTLAQKEDGWERDLIRLRAELSEVSINMLKAANKDRRFISDPDFAQEFETRFFNARQTLAQHQVKWRLDSIERDSLAYRESAAKVSQCLKGFQNWAEIALASADGYDQRIAAAN
jgi:hypothetical protein